MSPSIKEMEPGLGRRVKTGDLLISSSQIYEITHVYGEKVSIKEITPDGEEKYYPEEIYGEDYNISFKDENQWDKIIPLSKRKDINFGKKLTLFLIKR